MADIRIKDLTTLASASLTGDVFVIDGTTGTRKLSAFSPTFGGNATVTGTLTANSTITAANTIKYVNSGVANGTTVAPLAADIGADGTLGALQVTVGGSPSATGASRFGYIGAGDVGAWRTFIVGSNNSSGGGQVLVPSTLSSTSTSSGALVVSGGVGIGGSLNAGANNAANSITGGDSGSGTYILQLKDGGGNLKVTFKGNGDVNLQSSTASTSTSSGALVVSGGVGVAGAMYVGGAGDFAGQLNLNSGTASAPSLKLNSTNNGIYYTGSNIVRIAANGAEAATFGGAAATVVGSFQTGAPAGGTAAAWKLGTVATVSPTSPNRTIEVDIGGTIYYIHAKTTNN